MAQSLAGICREIQGDREMSEKIDNLIEIVKHMQKQQHILTKMLIHFGFRADLYDGFIRECFNELDSLKIPGQKFKDIELEADK